MNVVFFFLNFIIIYKIYIKIFYDDKNILKIKSDEISLAVNLFIISLLIYFILLKNVEIEFLKFYFFEMTLMMILVLEDEKDQTISLNIILFLAFYKIIMILLLSKVINPFVLLFSTSIYIGIYFISNKSIGEGDIVLNSLISLNFLNLIDYFRYFTLVFLVGSLFSIFGLLTKSLEKGDSIPFIKFIVLAYYIILIVGA